MDLLTFLVFIWKIFPKTGRGVGPGGSFPLACLWFHRKRKIKKERQVTRTTKSSIGVLRVRATESLKSKDFLKILSAGLSPNMQWVFELLNKYCFIISALWPVSRYLNKNLSALILINILSFWWKSQLKNNSIPQRWPHISSETEDIRFSKGWNSWSRQMMKESISVSKFIIIWAEKEALPQSLFSEDLWKGHIKTEEGSRANKERNRELVLS